MSARARIGALLRKELLDLSRNRGALLPVAIVTVLALALPFGVAIAIPALTEQPLGDDRDLLNVSRVLGIPETLPPDTRVQLFLFQQFLLLFLLTPITGSMALAAHSVVGEKQARTLEPLLATPVHTIELLVAKVLGALLPTLAIALVGLVLYFAGLALLANPGVLQEMVNVRTALLLFWIGPAVALVSLQGALIISSRVNDARTAQQFAVLIIVPIIGVLVAQFTGSLWLQPATLATAGAALLGLWAVLLAVSVVLFERESILTRWR
jgi:ABC-2 type transport system permease protein